MKCCEYSPWCLRQFARLLIYFGATLVSWQSLWLDHQLTSLHSGRAGERISCLFMLYYVYDQRQTRRRGRLSTVNLLIKAVFFVSTVNNIFNIKRDDINYEPSPPVRVPCQQTLDISRLALGPYLLQRAKTLYETTLKPWQPIHLLSKIGGGGYHVPLI
jgi:hypothetical protein